LKKGDKCDVGGSEETETFLNQNRKDEGGERKVAVASTRRVHEKYLRGFSSEKRYQKSRKTCRGRENDATMARGRRIWTI